MATLDVVAPAALLAAEAGASLTASPSLLGRMGKGHHGFMGEGRRSFMGEEHRSFMGEGHRSFMGEDTTASLQGLHLTMIWRLPVVPERSSDN
jgi:hypothetical protein